MAKCPSCGDKNAYIGSLQVECPHIGCRHFNQKQVDALNSGVEKKKNCNCTGCSCKNKTPLLCPDGSPNPSINKTPHLPKLFPDFSNPIKLTSSILDDPRVTKARAQQALEDWVHLHGAYLVDRLRKELIPLDVHFKNGELIVSPRRS